MLNAMANITAKVQFFIVFNEFLNLFCFNFDTFIVLYPVFQVKAVNEKRIDFVLVIVRWLVMLPSPINYSEAFVPSFHPIKLF